MTRHQVYRAKSGVMVVNEADAVCDERDHPVAALYGTYRKWYRRWRGVEAAPGRVGS